MLRPAVYFLSFFIFYLALAGKASPTELAAGAAAAAAGTGAALWVRSKARRSFRFRRRWLSIVLRRVPLPAVRDCGRVFLALWRYAMYREQIEGRFRVIPFDPGGQDPAAAARRALVLALLSLTPNTVAILIDREKERILVHQLVDTGEEPGGGDREWPL